jgi:hypothetical protein
LGQALKAACPSCQLLHADFAIGRHLFHPQVMAEADENQNVTSNDLLETRLQCFFWPKYDSIIVEFEFLGRGMLVLVHQASENEHQRQNRHTQYVTDYNIMTSQMSF